MGGWARWRLIAALMVVSLVMSGSAANAQQSSDGPWVETRFQTGCDPGPFQPPPPPERLPIPFPAIRETADPVALRVEVPRAGRPMLGSGFNLEHALWSCAPFRSVFRTQILDAFKPAIARLDTGLLPAAPEDLLASELHPAVYESVLSSPHYADSWRFFRRLNRAGVKIVLGIWGGPAQFTQDGTRLGVLDPKHYDDYVVYVATLVEFLVHRQNIAIWATTIANEPDGGDGNQIPPDGLAYIARQLGPRLAAQGVLLYGPDTATASDALEYLPPLLDDPQIAPYLAFVGFHQYEASPDVEAVVELVRGVRPDLPVIVTEYTSFGFGDLDTGQEASAQIGFTLEVASTVLAHYRAGVDAAIYWDAVDYLQPGHDAITRWGLLRGPGDDFQPRHRYFGLQQILAYLQPGSRVLEVQQDGGPALRSLALVTPDGTPVVFLVNQDYGPLALNLTLAGQEQTGSASMEVMRTGRRQRAERLPRMPLNDGSGQLILSARSITTLFLSGAGPQPDEMELARGRRWSSPVL